VTLIVVEIMGGGDLPPRQGIEPGKLGIEALLPVLHVLLQFRKVSRTRLSDSFGYGRAARLGKAGPCRAPCRHE
jgi:hypothetical protein